MGKQGNSGSDSLDPTGTTLYPPDCITVLEEGQHMVWHVHT